MRKIIILLISLFLLTACNSDPIIKENNNDSNKTIISTIVLDSKNEKVIFENNLNYMYIVYFYDGKIIYVSESGGGEYSFIRYDIQSDSNIVLGKIGDHATSSDVSVSDGYLYIYCTEDDSSSTSFKLVLYKIGLYDDTFERVSEEYLDQALVYVDTLDNKIISYKGKYVDDSGITYLDILDSENNNFENFLEFEFLLNSDSVRIIVDFCVSNDIVYVLIRDVANDTEQFYLNKYDKHGIEIESIILNEELTDIVSSGITTIEVFGDYLMLSPWHGTGIVLNISSDEWTEVFRCENLYISTPADDDMDIYFHSFDTDKMWVYISDKNEIMSLNCPYDNIRLVYSYEDDLFIRTADSYIYYQDIIWDSID